MPLDCGFAHHDRCSEELLPNRLIVVQPMYLSTISGVEVVTIVGIVLHQFVLQFAYI